MICGNSEIAVQIPAVMPTISVKCIVLHTCGSLKTMPQADEQKELKC